MTENLAGTQALSGDGQIQKALSLLELLPSERIKLDVQVDSWQEAVREAGKLLVESGAAAAEYIEAMIKVAEEFGPYIVIAPGIALPHAATESGAKRTALSMIRLTDPVCFGNAENDPVRLVFALAAIDKKAHLVALQTLAELLLSKELVQRLFTGENIASVIETLRLAEEARQAGEASDE